MAPVLVLNYLRCTSYSAQQQVVEAFKRIMAYDSTSKLGVTKYAITVPRASEPGHETDILTIEEYADESTLTAHMASTAVKELHGLFLSPPSSLASAPETYQFRPSVFFTKPEIKDTKNPVIISAHFGYQPGKSTPALSGWKPLVEYAEANEAGTLSYAVMDDTEKSFIRTAEVYESQAVIDAHLKGPLVAENQKQNGGWRSGERFVWRCELVGGYFVT